MFRAHARREAEDVVLYGDGSVDSALTKSAAAMLASVEAYLAEHPELDGLGRIPAQSERGVKPGMKMEA
jgi:hypothetical protein